jgi:thiosulfate/3-mercaptopyruvate sulfurtransferase
MFNTFYGLDTLSTPASFAAALFIGFFFGFALERAGFGSSKKLAGIFYFRDMTVLKVMFSGLIVAMLGIIYAMGFGFIESSSIYWLPTKYLAQIIGGLLFGVGFVTGGWCPGTAAVGVASGKLDALIFLCGGVIGSLLFNETYPLVEGVFSDSSGVLFAYDTIGVSRGTFAFFFTIVAVLAFWFSETAEYIVSDTGEYLNSRFLKVFSVVLIGLSFGTLAFPTQSTSVTGGSSLAAGTNVDSSYLGDLNTIESGRDHISPEELANALMNNETGLILVDVRPSNEFSEGHLPGAINVSLPNLESELISYKNEGRIVLYSNGMIHPAQGRTALVTAGFQNVYILSDGLNGFSEQILKPVSLRTEVMSEGEKDQINQWRNFFSGTSDSSCAKQVCPRSSSVEGGTLSAPHKSVQEKVFEDNLIPGFITTSWLSDNLNRKDLKIVDLRYNPKYNGGHIPGSINFNEAALRGPVNGIPEMLLPSSMIGSHLSLMGINNDDTVVIVSPEKFTATSLFAVALKAVGHTRYGILQGGFEKWTAEKREVSTLLPLIKSSNYLVKDGQRNIFVGREIVEEVVKGNSRNKILIDARPFDYYSGEKSDEARAGHIPSAVSLHSGDNMAAGDDFEEVAARDKLVALYGRVVPEKDSPVIVYCRTAQAASLDYMIMTDVLGYTNVSIYDGSWAEWSTIKDLPIEVGSGK